MKQIKLFNLPSLSTQDEQQLQEQHDAEIRELLPALGPLFGFAVILFSAWDYLIEPAQVLTTMAVRVGAVMLGSIAYLPTNLKWSLTQRCGFIYWTHASAIIICVFLLKHEFLYGLAGIVACVFTVPVVTLHIKTFLQILSMPTLLLIALGAMIVPGHEFITGFMLYVFSVCLAAIVMLVLIHLRKKSYLLEKKLLHISRHDSMTCAYNRGYLIELAEHEIALSKRHGRPLAIALLDIDHFKDINDNYGHNTGDEVIKKLVNTCMENLREIDHFGRIGGEEFVCVLPESDTREAMVCAERLRQSIADIRMENPQGELKFTVSIGVAVLSPAHTCWSALLKEADTAMYCAKHEGRNRVVMAKPDSQITA